MVKNEVAYESNTQPLNASYQQCKSRTNPANSVNLGQTRQK